MKLTLRDIKASRIPSALGICATDARLIAWLNEAVQRLRTKALWIGTYGRFRLCLSDGCVTLPPQLATIERIATCGQVLRTHDMFFEFLDNGFGPRNANCSGTGSGGNSCASGAGGGMAEANLRGWFPSFGDIRGTQKKLRFACDLASDVGKTVLALGYDDNGNWIRTEQSGVISDGELIMLAQAPGSDSTNFFSSLTGVQFPDERDGQVWLWERDTVASTSRLIGTYQYFETNPSYSRYYLPSVCTQQTSEGSCSLTTVEIIGRLEYIPVKNDTDYVMFGNVPALKNMMVAVKQYEEAVSTDDLNRAAAFEKLALRELDDEISASLGEGREVGMNVKGANIGWNNPVEALL